MSMKFKIGQVVRFYNLIENSVEVFPDDGTIGVVTRASDGSSAYPYSVKWFVSKPEVTEHYHESELRAVDEI